MSAEGLASLISKLEEILEGGDADTLITFLSSLSPYEFLEILERLDIGKRSKIISHVPLVNLKPILNKLPEDMVFELFRVRGIDDMIKVLIEMPSDEVADFLLKVPPKFRSKLMNLFPHWKMSEVSTLLKYPGECVGSVMTPQIPVFINRLTVADAIKEYIAKSELGLYDKHFYIYVVDDKGKLSGWIDVKSFISQGRNKLLKDIASKPPVVVNVRTDREEAAKIAVKYDLLEIPVVDDDGKLLGAVTLDDVLDVVIHEYTEDLLKFGGFTQAIKGRYLSANPITIVKGRFLPLVYLYLMNTITGGIVTAFTDVIERVAVLAAFLPMLADNSGNVGAQASTFIIRSLAVGEVGPHDILRVLKREVIISLALIALLSPISFAIGSSITYITYKSIEASLGVGLVVSIALIVSTLVADLVGVLLPLILSRIGVDPATVSAPLLTTIGDVITATTYFSVATLLLAFI
ncbi:MAG: magnesium transporter [Sulfolobales archaeon]|nr:magnesium transporter [Sulfolobales archaeon]MCX8186504.1 magnesium transporter [Sulfolobales archaeon]MDW7969052.1 magnesium transporter [Sulfolobales archaeon]